MSNAERQRRYRERKWGPTVQAPHGLHGPHFDADPASAGAAPAIPQQRTAQAQPPAPALEGTTAPEGKAAAAPFRLRLVS